MCKVKYLAIIGGLAWGLLIGMSSQVQAQANGFAAVTTRNLTNAVVRYAFWWGDNDGVVPPITTLGPDQSWYHYYPLDDDGLAPPPHIMFGSGGGAVQQYDLEFSTNYGSKRGNPYYFSYTVIGTIDLYNGPFWVP